MLYSLLFLSACGNEKVAQQNNAVSASATADVQTQLPTYKVTAYAYTPFVIRDDKGKVSGLEIDILSAIAKDQNIQLEFMPMLVQWDLLFDTIKNKQSDLLAAGMYDNENRRVQFETSQPYMFTQFAFLSKTHIDIHKMEDLKGKRVAVMVNSMAAKEIESLSYSKDIETMSIKSIYEGVKAVASGEVDVLYSDKMVLNYYANQLKEQKLHVMANEKAKQHQFVFYMTKGNTELLNKINTGLTNIQNNGSLDAIKQKWLGSKQP